MSRDSHPQPASHRPWELLCLSVWIAALVGYFGPWITHPRWGAALRWNAYDLFDLMRLLPEIETGQVSVSLHALRLPLIGLAVTLPLLLAARPLLWRALAAAVGLLLASATFPPYPYLIDAWKTPGWRVSFWWAVGGCLGALLCAWIAPHLRQYRLWLILAALALTGIPSAVTLQRLLPPLQALHASAVSAAWGFWTYSLGWLALGLLAWAQRWSPGLQGKDE